MPSRSDAEEDVRFGTDGWRGVIARDFTFDNVARAAQAIADYLRSGERPSDPIYTDWGVECADPSRGVVVGYDTRFLSEAFALHCAAVLRQNGIPTVVSASPVPTPAVSYAVVNRAAAMGVVLTSSHNPPEYNGLKIKAEYGGSAPESITRAIERRLPERAPAANPGEVERVDLLAPYLARLEELVDRGRLTASPIHVVVDSMHGSARGLVSRFLAGSHVPHTAIREAADVLFGGTNPEPLEKNLAPLRDAIRAARPQGARTIGVVTDGDGDRVSAMDEEGRFIDAHRTYALFLRYLVEERGWRGPVVVSFNLSDLIRRMAAAYGLETIETPVGFKHAAEHLVKRDVLIAGEESGSYAIRGHIPERDSFPAGLYVIDFMLQTGKTPSQLLEYLYAKVGAHYYDRIDLAIPADQRQATLARVRESRPERIAGLKVTEIDTLDGFRYVLEDGGWLLVRFSGTEPLVRVYTETTDPEKVQPILADGRKIVGL